MFDDLLGRGEKYDARVQAVLDANWPGTTELHNIKRSGNKVYTAKYLEETVIVKSTSYSAELESQTKMDEDFVNYLGESVSTADYITPYWAASQDSLEDALWVTVSRCVPGVAPDELWGVEYAWYTNEEVATSIGKYLAQMRKTSQSYTNAHSEEYASFISWDEMYDGAYLDPRFYKITIPPTPENFGVIHGDLHRHNLYVDLDNHMSVSSLDFDNAQKSWYVIDIGTHLMSLQQ